MALSELAGWKSDITTDEELTQRFFDLLERDEARIKGLQTALSKPLETEDGAALAKQLAWLDAQLYFIGTLQADADALLDLAERYYLMPQGRMIPATFENGSPYQDPKTGNGKFEKVTDLDRDIHIKAKCAPFRRLRNEYQVMGEVLKNRQFLGQRILDELKERTKAAGLAARR